MVSQELRICDSFEGFSLQWYVYDEILDRLDMGAVVGEDPTGDLEMEAVHKAAISVVPNEIVPGVAIYWDSYQKAIEARVKANKALKELRHGT